MSGRFKQLFENNFSTEKAGGSYVKEADETTGTDGKNIRKYSISRSGKFKQMNKHRDPLNTNLFSDDKVEEDIANNSHPHPEDDEFSGKKLAEIEKWIENSFRPALEGYKTVRSKNCSTRESSFPNNNNNISNQNPSTRDNDGQLETAL